MHCESMEQFKDKIREVTTLKFKTINFDLNSIEF